jgi:16S rRNA (adenine1518-N6/adenine1519-N6)-dimethyltransferase
MKDLVKITKDICNEYNIKPARHRGQSFLIKEEAYNDIISASDLKRNDKVLEIGPGLGFLTEKLSQTAKEVVSVELDKRLCHFLKERFEGVDNFHLVNDDILNINPTDLWGGGKEGGGVSYKIVANIPYNITSIFLRRFLSQVKPPSLMVLMIQKEVAERITASPPSGVLSVMVQFYAEPYIIKGIPQNDFWPSPKVDSAIIKLKIKKGIPPVDENVFFDMVRKAFSSRRKMVKNNLSAGYNLPADKTRAILEKAGINIGARAQDLYLEDWVRLFGWMRENMI